jgi:hypothetical protein
MAAFPRKAGLATEIVQSEDPLFLWFSVPLE